MKPFYYSLNRSTGHFKDPRFPAYLNYQNKIFSNFGISNFRNSILSKLFSQINVYLEVKTQLAIDFSQTFKTDFIIFWIFTNNNLCELS